MDYLKVWPFWSSETTLNGRWLSSAAVIFTDAVSDLPSDWWLDDSCLPTDDFEVSSSDLAESTANEGVRPSDWIQLSNNLPPPVLSDLTESFNERSDIAGVIFSTAPWWTLTGFSASVHDIYYYTHQTRSVVNRLMPTVAIWVQL